MKHTDFVDSAIQDLLDRGLIVTCEVQPTVVNPLTVSIHSNGKKRLILDLRVVNKHLWKHSVKYEDMRTATQHIKHNSSLFKFDIHSAYHHVDIFCPHTEYLGFSWLKDGVRIFYKFLVLASACYLFTKITRPLVKKWRSEGKQIIMYLDDGIGIDPDEQLCQNIANEVKINLIKSGFVPKAEKSFWQPVKRLVLLGTIIDTEYGYYKIPEDRVEKIINTITDI